MSGYIDKISDKNALLLCAEQLRKKKFNPGFDGMTSEKAYMWLGINGLSVSEELKKGRYKPMPVVGFYITKRNGRYRRLSKTAALDTIIQNLITEVTREECETKFSDYSHAYRIGKGVGTALEQYCSFASKYPMAGKIDPISFFDNIDRDILRSAVNEFFGDEELTELIMSFVKAPLYNDGRFEYPDKGIFQGAPISICLVIYIFIPWICFWKRRIFLL